MAAKDSETARHMGRIGPVRRVAKALAPFTQRANALWCNSWGFKKLARKVFKEADVDGSGQLNDAELYVCILRIYDRANEYLTTHVRAPSKKEVTALLKKYDLDKSGSLDINEFLQCAQAIMGFASPEHSIPLNILAVLVLRISILPTVAAFISSWSQSWGGMLAPLSWVPIAAYSVFLELVLRYIWAFTSD